MHIFRRILDSFCSTAGSERLPPSSPVVVLYGGRGGGTCCQKKRLSVTEYHIMFTFNYYLINFYYRRSREARVMTPADIKLLG